MAHETMNLSMLVICFDLTTLRETKLNFVISVHNYDKDHSDSTV